MTESEKIRQQLLDILLTEDEKERLEPSKNAWWQGGYCVPPKNADLEESNRTNTRTKYKSPREKDALFYMPPDEHDFECHECGGQYGPWVHSGLSVNMDGGFGEKPIYANILHKRNRWCLDCGYEFYNCYAVGKVYFERDDQGLLQFDHFW